MGRAMALIGICAAIIGGIFGYAAGGELSLASAPPAVAAEDCQTFEETGKTVCGIFLRYWREHGGLAQQGLPLSDAANERSNVDGKIYLTQYFERAVFEHHPENRPPYDVLLSLLGREKYLTTQGGVTPTKPSIIGQQVNADGTGYYGKVTLRAEVLDIREGVTITRYGQAVAPTGKFVVVFLRVSNLGSVPGYLVGNPLLLADRHNRQFAGVSSPSAIDGAAAMYKLPNYNATTVEPGLAIDAIAVFDVLPDAAEFRLVVASAYQPR